MPPRLAFCSWSVGPDSPSDLIEQASAIGVHRVQLHLNRLADEESWRDAQEQLGDAGIEIVSGMFSPLGEDYSTPSTIRVTGGVVSDSLWEENFALFRAIASRARLMQLPIVTFHAGFIPEQNSDDYEKLADRIRRLAVVLREEADAKLLLETGQETANHLLLILDALAEENVGVNFDPANMLLYDMGDPIKALEVLYDHVRQIHIKDAKPPEAQGEWGLETPMGEGDVDWEAFFALLTEREYSGDFVIERESGDSRTEDIRNAASRVTALLY